MGMNREVCKWTAEQVKTYRVVASREEEEEEEEEEEGEVKTASYFYVGLPVKIKTDKLQR